MEEVKKQLENLKILKKIAIVNTGIFSTITINNTIIYNLNANLKYSHVYNAITLSAFITTIIWALIYDNYCDNLKELEENNQFIKYRI